MEKTETKKLIDATMLEIQKVYPETVDFCVCELSLDEFVQLEDSSGETIKYISHDEYISFINKAETK